MPALNTGADPTIPDAMLLRADVVAVTPWCSRRWSAVHPTSAVRPQLPRNSALLAEAVNRGPLLGGRTDLDNDKLWRVGWSHQCTDKG